MYWYIFGITLVFAVSNYFNTNKPKAEQQKPGTYIDNPLCLDGVKYFVISGSVTVAYTKDGKVQSCD